MQAFQRVQMRIKLDNDDSMTDASLSCKLFAKRMSLGIWNVE